MIQKNKGQIVSVASVAGTMGSPFLTDYCASKFACVGMMEALRLELKRAGKYGVNCTTINPFFNNTGMFDGTKTGRLFPFLEQQHTIDRMVIAILQNEEEVSIPWS